MALWKAVEKGEMVTRDNTQRAFGSDTQYEFVWVTKGGKPHLLAFTKNEIDEAEKRAIKNVEDMPMLKRKGFFNW